MYFAPNAMVQNTSENLTNLFKTCDNINPNTNTINLFIYVCLI